MSDAALHAARRRLEANGRVLITRLRYIGDVVLSLPLVHALRRTFPSAALHYLADASALSLLEHHPDVDRRWTHVRGVVPGLRLASKLRAQEFDVVIDLFCNPRSALLARATGAGVRIGEARRGRRHLYTHARRLLPGRSALHQHLDAAALLGVDETPQPPRLFLSPEERARGRVLLRDGAHANPRVVVHTAATQPEKEWPSEHAVACVERLVDTGHRVFLTTAPHRPQPAHEVARRVPAATRLPELGLRDVLGALAAADAVVSVDGALVHCSVALGRPTLALFGPTDAEVWFPYAAFGPYRVLRAANACAACQGEGAPHTCMTALDVDAVLCSLRALLEASAAQRGTASR